MMRLDSGLRRANALPQLDAPHWPAHPLHGENAVWPETNCYLDLWITLLPALGADPHAMLGPLLAVDFEGDQWTFFKPSHDELRHWYGVDVQELTVWRPLAEHALEHLSAGKLISVETDAFWLPDVAGTDYRRQHSKTTIVLLALDLDARRLVYLHNAGCFELQGEDFDQTLPLGGATAATPLPLFAEVLRLDRRSDLPLAELQYQARQRLPALLARVPQHNPLRRFAQRFEADLPTLRERGLDHYHAWAFAGTRQCGAAFSLVSRWLAWWAPAVPDAELSTAIEAFEAIGQGSKTLILKGARAATSAKAVDLSAQFEALAQSWDTGMAALRRLG
jgi:hypothetical protein